jgi:ribosomal protein S18 acetylase RimI-like enzyme
LSTGTRLLVEVLASGHDRSEFSCGKEPLDRYLRQQAGQDVRRRLAAVFVVCSPGTSEVIAYYTLSALSIPVDQVTAELRRRIPYPEVPAVLLGRLAVDRQHGGQGLGSMLVVDAAMRSMAVKGLAVWAMVVDPIDEQAAGFYRRLGFIAFADRKDRLYLPLSTFRTAPGR